MGCTHTVTKLQHSESTRRQDGKGEAHIGKVDAILTDSHLDMRIRMRVLKNVIVPNLEHAGEVWEGNAKSVKQLETAQMASAKKILGC